MSISAYDPNRFDRELPANVRGGLQRAKEAARDLLGRFLPAMGTPPYNPQHGKVGGMKRARTGKRDNKGRYTK